MQHQLEESFFHQQPASVRETVQFVGEQLVTNCVRHLRCSHIPEAVASHTDQVLRGAVLTFSLLGLCSYLLVSVSKVLIKYRFKG